MAMSFLYYIYIYNSLFPPETQPNRVGRCGLGGVKGHIKVFEKAKQGVAPYKIDAGGDSV